MSLSVVDASAIVDLLIGDDSPRRRAVKSRLTGGDAFFAPAHLDVEVLSALRGLARKNQTITEDGPQLVAVMSRLPIRRLLLTHQLSLRVWELRHTMTTYDAGYVAVAEELAAPLLTCDAKHLAATGPRCAVELIA